MGNVLSFFDGLKNAITGTGTNRDARTANHYVSRALGQAEIAAAYSASGLMRKIVRIPALDVVREWRDWTGLNAEQAAAVFEQEKRHAIRQKVQQVETLRGMGGGALILGLPGLPETPAPDITGKNGLAYVNVVSRWSLTFEDMQDDARLPGFGEPAMWRVKTKDGQDNLHPSRVIPFRADTTASLAMPSTWTTADAFWGESTVQQVLDAVQDNDSARASFAAILHKARSLRLGVRGLYEMLAAGQDSVISDRLQMITLAESIHNAIVFDAGDDEGKGGETITDAQYSFTGAKDMLNNYAEFVAAISDIPATRLLGRAPEGLNSSGESQQADWNKKIRAHQTLDLGPCLDRLDRYLIPSAIGSMPSSVAYDFAPLDTPDQEKVATRFKTQMEAASTLRDLSAIPDQAFARGLQSLMIEEGYLPELEAALSKLSDDERYGIQPSGGAEGREVIEPSAGASGVGLEAEPLRRAANDAKPRTLYVSRKLLNAAEVLRWANGQGFKTTLPAADMHVTVLYSKAHVDWMKMGEDFGGGELTVSAGGARLIEQFDGGAVVLLFNSSTLSWRHEEMVRNGASHDFPEYQSHVTITYDPGEVDVAQIEPYRGELRFGPEIFEELDEDWKANLKEK